jgi:hypothetical protein
MLFKHFLFAEKAAEGPYWERLLEDKSKQHWLKVWHMYYMHFRQLIQSFFQTVEQLRNLPVPDKQSYTNIYYLQCFALQTLKFS